MTLTQTYILLGVGVVIYAAILGVTFYRMKTHKNNAQILYSLYKPLEVAHISTTKRLLLSEIKSRALHREISHQRELLSISDHRNKELVDQNAALKRKVEALAAENRGAVRFKDIDRFSPIATSGEYINLISRFRPYGSAYHTED